MKPVFYGWYMVAIAMLVMALSVGLITYSFGLIIPALENEFGTSRTIVNVNMTLNLAVSGLIAPFLGRAIDNASIRIIFALGSISLAAGFILISFSTRMWHILFLHATLIPIGFVLLGNLSTGALVANWFDRKTGLAVGISAIGVSLGGFLLPPVTNWLITNWDWRAMYQFYAIVLLLTIIPLSLLFVINQPESIGLDRDGAEPAEKSIADSTRPTESALSTKQIMQKTEFWILTITITFIFSAYIGLVFNLASYALELGVDTGNIPLLMSCTALNGIIGKLAFGYLADQIEPRLSLTITVALLFSALCTFLLSSEFIHMLAGTVLLGLSSGGMRALFSALVALLFGRMNFGRAMGLIQIVMTPLLVSSPLFCGWIFDHYGSYKMAFLSFAFLLSTLFIVLRFLKSPSRAAPVQEI